MELLGFNKIGKIKKVMIKVDKDYIIKIRREIHEYPETGFDLPRTTGIVKRELESFGIEYTEKYCQGSVVGYINPKKQGFTICIRADMDALNMQEEVDLPFKSKIDGKMHACGHDAHTAMLLGAAKYLKSIEKDLNCRVKLLFQPCEEGPGSGAIEMVQAGVLEDVDVIIGLHVEDGLHSGILAVCSGSSQASSRNFLVEIFGKTAHITTPEFGIDALRTAVEAYTNSQKYIAKRRPKDRCAYGFGTLNAGRTQNNFADYASMSGTIRTFDIEDDKFVIDSIERAVKEACEKSGATYKITAPLKCISVYNNPYICTLLEDSFSKVVGKENVKKMHQKMGSEDFSRYVEKKPGALFRLGIKNPEKGMVSETHLSDFLLDEEVLDLGASAFVQFVLDNQNGIDMEKIEKSKN